MNVLHMFQQTTQPLPDSGNTTIISIIVTILGLSSPHVVAGFKIAGPAIGRWFEARAQKAALMNDAVQQLMNRIDNDQKSREVERKQDLEQIRLATEIANKAKDEAKIAKEASEEATRKVGELSSQLETAMTQSRMKDDVIAQKEQIIQERDKTILELTSQLRTAGEEKRGILERLETVTRERDKAVQELNELKTRITPPPVQPVVILPDSSLATPLPAVPVDPSQITVIPPVAPSAVPEPKVDDKKPDEPKSS